jgi:O-antigen/teichoic acid export membrane protein
MTERAGAEAETRSYGRTAGLLSAGIGTAGIITYLYFAIASHVLSRAEYGGIVVLWSVVIVTVSVLYRPVEQRLSRTLAERRERGLGIRSPMRVAASIQLGIAAMCAVTVLALRGPIEDGILDGHSGVYWVLVVAIVAYAASYYARGFLAGTRRFGLLAGLLLNESVSRVAFALAVAIGIAGGQTAVALGVAMAPVLSLLIVPLAFVGGHRARSANATTPPVPAGTEPSDSEFTLARGGSFAAAVLLIMLSEQTFLNGGPLLVRGADGAAAAGFIFNVLMVARAPLLLFQGISTSLLPHLTRLRSRGGEEGDAAFRLSIRATLTAIAGFAAIAVVVMAGIGPHLMQVAFGDKFAYDRLALILVSVGMGLYLAAATLNQAALAQGQARRAAACWVACAIGFLVWNLLPVLGDFRRVEIGFVGAATTLCGLLYLLYRNPVTRRGDEVEAGSAAEIGVQLAAADEAG